jgi:hypothetical protein
VRFNKKNWLYPIIFFEIYLSISLILFIFGPWPWPISDKTNLILYLIFSQFIIFIGYIKGWSSTKKLYANSTIEEKNCEIKNGILLLKISLFVSAFLLIPTSLSRTGNILPNIIDGITNPGLVYNNNTERLESGNPFIYVEYIRLLVSIFLISLWPLTIVYWTYLSIFLKISCLTIIMGNLSIYVATGTNKGLADFIITLPWLILLANVASKRGFKISKLYLVSSAFILIFIFMLLFTFGQLQRSGGVADKGVMNLGSELIYANSDKIQPYLNENIIKGYESITRYLGSGYYALSLALKVDSPSTLGLGNSMFIARNADSVFDTNFFTDESLPGRLESEFEFSRTQLWHSIYTWLASDFGFVGTALLLGFFSYLLAVSWGSSLIKSSPYMIVMQYMLLIMFYYIPANNQIFQTGETCIGFIMLVLFIMVKKLKKRIL